MPKATSKIIDNHKLQLFFIFATLSVYLADLINTLWIIGLQLPSNTNISAFVPMLLFQGSIPLLFALIWLSRRQRKLTTATFFEISLLTTATIALSQATSVVLFQLPLLPAYSFGESTLLWQIYWWGAPFTISLAVLVLVIRHLRQSKQW